VVNRRPVTAKAWGRSQANSCEICGGSSGTGTWFFLLAVLSFPGSIVSLVLHIHSLCIVGGMYSVVKQATSHCCFRVSVQTVDCWTSHIRHSAVIAVNFLFICLSVTLTVEAALLSTARWLVGLNDVTVLGMSRSGDHSTDSQLERQIVRVSEENREHVCYYSSSASRH